MPSLGRIFYKGGAEGAAELPRNLDALEMESSGSAALRASISSWINIKLDALVALPEGLHG